MIALEEKTYAWVGIAGIVALGVAFAILCTLPGCGFVSGIGGQKATYDQHRNDQDSIIGLHVETYFNEGQYSPLTHSLILADMDSLIAYDSTKAGEANTVHEYVLAEANWVSSGALEAKEQPAGASIKFYARCAEIQSQMWANILNDEKRKGH